MRLMSATPHLLRSNQLTMGFCRTGLGLCAAVDVVAGPHAPTVAEDAEAEAAGLYETADIAVCLAWGGGLDRRQHKPGIKVLGIADELRTRAGAHGSAPDRRGGHVRQVEMPRHEHLALAL
ncbi:hypothetical protein JCM2811A_13520 [Methylorubrum rhodinum]